MISFIFFIFGLIFGSFLNVMILRLPKGESIVFPASHCCSCNKSLKWYHNIPVFSWVFLGGKCAYCKEKISIQYPFVELMSAIIFLVFSFSSNLIDAISLSFCFVFLFALSIVDLRYKAVPDLLLILVFVSSLMYANPIETLTNSLLFAGGFAMLRFLISALLKKEAMGEADIVIAAVIGALLGVKLGLIAIYISAIFALIGFIMVRKQDFELPFIPFLSLGLFISFIFSENILQLLKIWYE